jgi:predicted permease
MGHLPQDLRHALRQLRRKPLFTATAVLTLAIGMGVNTVAFSVVNGMLFKGFALKGVPGVGRVATTPGGDESGYASIPEYQRFREATSGSLDLEAEGRSAVAWKHDGTTDTAWVLYVSGGYFSIVQPPLVAGRLAVARDGDAVSVVIGERFWRETLQSASLAGLTLRLNDTDVSVAGVIDGGFTGPAGIYSPDIWLPLEDRALFGASPLQERRDTRWLFLMGRVRDGATATQIHGQVQAAAADMTREWPDTHTERGAVFRLLEGGNAETRGLATAAAIAMGIIGVVLLLACFNVANLLLARAVERERDMGIRTALGARPLRLMQMVVTEGLVIAVCSGVLALLLAWWTQALVGSFAIPIEQPQHIDLTPDARVIVFILTLVFVTGVLPGLWPALAAARVDVLRVLGSQGANAVAARPSGLGRWLVGAQVAGSTMFLAITGLFLQSYSTLTTFDVGFARDQVVIADYDPVLHGFDAAASERFVTALGDRLRGVPGVVDVAAVDHAPFFVGYAQTTAVWPPGRACDGDCRSYATYAASPGYFRTMGITIAEGREFTTTDTGSQVVINGMLARALWPTQSAVGETLRIGSAGEVVTVVGVTAPTRTRGLDRETPVLFVPLRPSHYERGVSIVIRAARTPSVLVQPVIETAREVNPNVVLVAVKTMAQRMAVQLWPFRTLTRLFAICGTLALLLATVGLAGVVVHAVSRRVREFGVRLSVGATPRDLAHDVLRSSARLLAPGLVVGLVLAAVAARLAQVIFVGVDVLNPATYLVVAIIQTAIVGAACVGPALRASRVDPLTALRSE